MVRFPRICFANLLLSVLCCLMLVEAQSSSYSEASSTTSSAPAQTHVITVGKADHKFSPEVTQAEVGDIIEFQFFPPNHSVVRAEFGYPCVPYEKIGKGRKGFFSDFNPVDVILNDPPKYQIRINDTDPIFFYCSAPDSCIKWGMVGVINPNATTSLGEQRNLALKAAYMLQPGEPFPAEGSPTPPPERTSSSADPSNTNDYSSSDSPALMTKKKNALSAGAIAGIVVGAVVFLAIVGLLVFYILRSRALKKQVAWKNSIVRPYDPHSQPSSTIFPFGTGPGSGGGRSATAPTPVTGMTESTTGASRTPRVYFPAPAPAVYEKSSELGNGDERSPERVLSPWRSGESGGIQSPGEVARSASQRSTAGGVFEFSPVMGRYVRRSEDGGKGGMPPLGPYGRQQFERFHNLSPGYSEPVGPQAPVEMDGREIERS